jgi:hypothetical protein
MMRAITVAVLVAITMAGVVLVRGPGGEADDGADAVARAAVRTGLWNQMQAAAGDVPVGEPRAALRREVRAARGRPAHVPAALQAKVRASLGVPADVPFENAHRLTTPRGRLWLADLRRATCIIRAHDGALACDTTAHVARRGLVLSVFAVEHGHMHDFVLFGLAPDGSRRARLRTGGRLREVPVRGNTFAAAATRPITLEKLLG